MPAYRPTGSVSRFYKSKTLCGHESSPLKRIVVAPALAVGNDDLAVDNQVMGWNASERFSESGHSMRPVMAAKRDE